MAFLAKLLHCLFRSQYLHSEAFRSRGCLQWRQWERCHYQDRIRVSYCHPQPASLITLHLIILYSKYNIIGVVSYGLGCGSEFRGKGGNERRNNDKDCYWKENLCQGYQGECLVLLTGFMPALRMELFVIFSSLSAFSSVITTIKIAELNIYNKCPRSFW